MRTKTDRILERFASTMLGVAITCYLIAAALFTYHAVTGL